MDEQSNHVHVKRTLCFNDNNYHVEARVTSMADNDLINHNNENSLNNTDCSVFIETEEISSKRKWRGKFSKNYIEEITSKTGNFKRFLVFVRMLMSAIRQESDNVLIDLLTYGDLEILKARKTGREPDPDLLDPKNPKNNIKRYLILTYVGEFDRVHYPLPLLLLNESTNCTLQEFVPTKRNDVIDKSADEQENEEEEGESSEESASENDSEEENEKTSGSQSGNLKNNEEVMKVPKENSNMSGHQTDVTSSAILQLQKENQELRLSLRRQAEETIKSNSIQLSMQEVNKLKIENDNLKQNLRRKEEEIIHVTSQQIEFQHHYTPNEEFDPSIAIAKTIGQKSGKELPKQRKDSNTHSNIGLKLASSRSQKQKRSGTPLKNIPMLKNKDLHENNLHRRIMELEEDLLREQGVIKKLQNKHKREMAELVKNLEKEISSGRVLRSKNRELQREVTRLKHEVDSFKATRNSTSRSTYSYTSGSRNPRTNGYNTPTNSSRNRTSTTTPRSVGSRGSGRSLGSNRSYNYMYGDNEKSMYSSRDSLKSGSYTPKSVSSLGSRMSSGSGVSNRSKRSTTPSYTRSTASYRSQTNKSFSSVNSRSPLPRGYTSPYSQKALNVTSSSRQGTSSRTPSQKRNTAVSRGQNKTIISSTRNQRSYGNSTNPNDYDENGVYIRRANGSDRKSTNVNSPYSVRSAESRNMSYLGTTNSSRRSKLSNSTRERGNTSENNEKKSKSKDYGNSGTLRAKTTSLTIPSEGVDHPRALEVVSSSYPQHSANMNNDNNSIDTHQKTKGGSFKMPNSARNYVENEFKESFTPLNTNLSAMLRRPSPRKQDMNLDSTSQVHGSDPVLDLKYQRTPQYAWEDQSKVNEYQSRNKNEKMAQNQSLISNEADVTQNENINNLNTASKHENAQSIDDPTIEITSFDGECSNLVHEKKQDETIESNNNKIGQTGYDSGSEIGEIDRRLNALQAFLKQAKSGVIGKIQN